MFIASDGFTDRRDSEKLFSLGHRVDSAARNLFFANQV
jgi:hypothetical protein